MPTWLFDPALLRSSGSLNPTPLQRWCKAEAPSLFLSQASICLIAAAIEKSPKSQSKRRSALNAWLDNLTTRFPDRIHDVDAAISKSAGVILPQLTVDHPRHHLHDAILIGTARAYGHGLVTRRDAVFGPWTQIPIAVI
jgi:hypothetical protein